MAKPYPKDGMQFIQVVPLEIGVIEFIAWEKALWLAIWNKPHNQKSTIPHLAYLDTPGGRQQTWRILVLEGQAEMPMEEKEWWTPLNFSFPTRRSFATVWMSSLCMQRKTIKEGDRGKLKAKEVKATPAGGPEFRAPEEVEAFAP